MKLKKINAVLSILSMLALLVHVGYSSYAYLTFYYNPTLKMLTSLPFIVFVCLHAICGMCVVFLQNDGTRLDVYKKQNKGIIMQRVSAAFIFPLLIVHLKTFELLNNSSADGRWAMFGLVTVVQIAFYALVFTHAATSFSKAFITLGVLTDAKKQKSLDRFAYIFCGAVFLAASISVVRGELMMFIPK